MNKSHLRACTACTRHVRVSEVACPFCGIALSADFRASPAPQPPRARLSRAALFAFGTGTLAIGAGCSSTTRSSAPPVETFDAAYGGSPIEADDAGGGSVTPLYGAPAVDGSTPTDADEDGPAPIETVDAAYGGAPLEINAGSVNASND